MEILKERIGEEGKDNTYDDHFDIMMIYKIERGCMCENTADCSASYSRQESEDRYAEHIEFSLYANVGTRDRKDKCSYQIEHIDIYHGQFPLLTLKISTIIAEEQGEREGAGG